MRETWDAAAAVEDDLVVGDPLRAAEEVELLFDRDGITRPARGRCVEIGCGPARMTVELARSFDEVVAVDVSPMMLTRAARRLSRDGLANVRLRLVSGKRLDGIGDGTADVVVSYETIQHLPSRRLVAAYFAECVRILAPGGQAVIQIPVLDEGVRPRVWRFVRSLLVPPISIVSRSLFSSRAYRGTRLTRTQLERALARAGADVVAWVPGRDWRVGGSSFTNCHEVFVRFERAPAPATRPLAAPTPETVAA
jgi:SAM-dependent methyltransferase